MRDHNASVLSGSGTVGEIGHVLADLSLLDSVQNRILVYKQVTGKIEENHPVLHLVDCFLVDHTLCGIHQRHMNRDQITLFINFLHVQNMLHVTAQIPCRIHGYIRVVTVYFHAQMLRHIGHSDTDRTQSDDTQLLTLDFGTCKILLRLLRVLSYILVALVFLHPLDTAYHITGS